MAKHQPPYRRPHAPFPKDFGVRLEKLKDAAGVSWCEFAERLGTDPKVVRRWRAGQLPSGKYILALLKFTGGNPTGLEILLQDQPELRSK